MSGAGIHGRWHPAFAPLAEAFAASVEAGEERGALCVMRAGVALVDVWGGEAAPGRPWAEDTLACCFSVTKGVLSLLAHLLIDRGAIGADTRIAEVWPEFAAGGKVEVTLDDLLTHRAGLPWVAGPVHPGDLHDWDGTVARLAASPPVVPARADPVYHNMTYGHLLGETLRRAADGATLPKLIDELLTGPLGADFYLGLGPAKQARTARLTQDDPEALFRALGDAPDTPFALSMRGFAPGEDFNSDAWRGAAIGSGSGHATARALAILYGQLIGPGSLLSAGRRAALGRERARSTGPDPILGLPIRYAQGFEISLPPGLDFGPDPACLGYWGAGGATAFAAPHRSLSFGYVTGRMDPKLGSSDRCRRLVAALNRCEAR